MPINSGTNKPETMTEPLVSIIIPTFNSAKTLSIALQSLITQSYRNKEIIVVDNFSTDNTRAIADRYEVRVHKHGNERASQLNYGISKAKGKYIFETGSDMVTEPNYIKQAVMKCEEGFDAIYSCVVSKEQKTYWGKVKAMERQCYIGSPEVEAAHFFRKTAFDSLGEFDKSLISVEEDFQHRLDKAGFKTGYIQAKETHLHEAKTLKEIALKSYYYGVFISAYLKKHPFRGTKYLQPMRPSFAKHINLFISHPVLTCGFVVYKIVQYSAGILGLLLGNRINLHERIYGKNTTNNSTT